jgi:tRNA modification GTPase
MPSPSEKKSIDAHPRTTACLLTPPGRGAVATISLEGPRALEFLEQRFDRKGTQSIKANPQNVPAFGKFRFDDSKDSAGEEAVVWVQSDTSVELHCHGGPLVVERLLESLARLGAEIVEADGWQKHRESDPIRRAALSALPQARTSRTASLLLRQGDGVLRQAVEHLCNLLKVGRLDEAEALTERLLSNARIGRRLTSPFDVVLAGPPNVGKSSLINALVGYDRAIVHDQPGTTRDAVSVETALDGWPVMLSDTAGLRDAQNEVEGMGVDIAVRRLAQADLKILAFDATDADSQQTLSALPPILQKDALLIYNKVDLADAVRECSDNAVQYTSAASGEGLKELVKRIVARLVPDTLGEDEPIPFTETQAVRIQDVRIALQGSDAARAIRLLTDESPFAVGGALGMKSE